MGWRIVDDVLASEAASVPEAAAPAAEVGAPVITADELAMRALAARAQQSVFELEGAGGARGSAFVAWTENGRSYLLTAHRVVAGILADDGREVFVRRGNRFWSGRIFAADRPAGLALVRVDTMTLADPLWQGLEDERLSKRDRAVVVPAGPNAAFGEGTVANVTPERLVLPAGAEELNVGAPVVAANGRLAGVVVSTTPNGVNRVAPVDLACRKIRRCN